MKFISWNVNGIRAILNKGFLEFIAKAQPDVLCLQETKAFKEQVSLTLDEYPYQYWNSAKKPGYSGTAIFSKIKPIEHHLGMGIDEHDNEGRILTLDFKDYYLVTVYTPNSKRELERLDYRVQWDKEFLKFLKKLEAKKPVIFCGDLNVAHKEIDLANPKTNRRNAGFTDEEREGFTNLVEAGFVDTFREFHTEGGQYTWWSYMNNARAKNIGWRIDYFCVSDSIKKELKDASIHMSVLGSDHCPVELKI